MKLLEPIQIGPVGLKNRIVMAPMATQFATFEGMVTSQLIHYYIERSKGGAGLIITESCAVRFDGRGTGRRLGIYKDELVPGLTKLTDAVHRHGSKIVSQLHHGGRICSPKAIFEYPISPSSVPCPFYGGQLYTGVIPRTLLKQEIMEIEKDFAAAAKRAQKAGFDGVQVHAAHGYLINNFLSPYVNKRTDEYGGNFPNRVRFLLEIVKRVRDEIGNDIALLVRIDGDEYVEHGYKVDEAILIAKELEKAGIDEINIAAGNYEAIERQIPPMSLPRGCHVHLAEAVKRAVSIPVSTVGRINDTELAEEILRDNKADLIYMGRALIADPELPKKLLEGREDEIRKCLACNKCASLPPQGLNIECSVNGAVGYEHRTHLAPRKKPRLVVIVGGGPAGMEAARISAMRNNKVILFEKQDGLGGSVRIAGIPKDRTEVLNIVDYLANQMQKLKVDVRTGVEFKPKMIGDLKPDAVVLATGALPFLPRVKGLDSKKVRLAEDILQNPIDQAKSVVIIGGGLIGCETASHLLDRGIPQITLLEILDDIAGDEEKISRKVLLKKLMERGVRVLLETHAEKVEKERVLVRNKIGERSSIEADLVVVATGYKPDQRLYDKILKKYRHLASRIFCIGDCSKTGKIYDAIHAGYNLGFKV